jgi:hypothetical protein
MENLIPKRIIHIWGQGEANMPMLAKASIANAKLLNPDFEFLFFDDENIDLFISDNFPEYLKPLRLFPYRIQRYDFFRYVAIYKLGGFYLDLDLFLVTSLQDLLKYPCVFSFEELTINNYLRKYYNIDWEIGNYAFGASSYHPFIYAVIENCLRALRDPDWVKPMMKKIPSIFHSYFYPFYTSGPGLVTRTLVERRDLADKVRVLFPENVCDKNNWNLFGNYGIHLHNGTWVIRGDVIQARLLRLWMSWLRRKTIKQSLKMGIKRSWN